MREFGLRGGPRRCQVSGAARDAQGQVLLVGDVDVAEAMERSTDCEHGKAAPEQWVHGVDDLDLSRQLLIVWVLEGGIKVSGRLTG